ncbi:MAG: site-specific DNA-methyltransferase [Aestuariivita sp.]|nr:site-specific DNA-methyltransferase [Aestuariivita sp.]MCY4201869.1 site-specific DNA-methyltransferase [Aestuariivita sp.]
MTEPNWGNRTLWTGDNLDVMRGMNSQSLDLIYLDPPFNSNRDYAAPIGSEAAGAAFKDTWTLDDVDQAWHGEIAERQPTLYAIIDAAGLAHGKGMKSYLIMMAVRLLEMRRILKPTGSIYLHCDDTAVHYLKMLMDSVWKPRDFRNHLAWQRVKGNKGSNRAFPRNADHLLFYAASDASFARQYLPLVGGGLVNYRYRDPDGRVWRRTDLTGPGVSDGESGEPWNGWDPSMIGRHWAVPKGGAYAGWIESELIPDYGAKSSVHQRLDALNAAGLIDFSNEGIPALKRYLDQSRGSTVSDIWTDIDVVKASSKEGTSYPTQKPLALLDRIIRASSNEGDVVLDPFCGCATACVAADRLDRKWVGIDISPLAARLVLKRLRDDRGPLFDDVTHRTDVPTRNDLGNLPKYRTHRHTLYGKQEGICAGCCSRSAT